MPDRQALTSRVLPAFAALSGSILWAGCRAYTVPYYTLLELQGGLVSTLDHDPPAAAYGRPGRHVTGDLRAAHVLYGRGAFDAVLCNGVFGFGINADEDQSAALAAMHAVLKPGGRLLLGWDTDRIDSAAALARAAPLFTLQGFSDLPALITAPPSRHEIRLFVRREI